MQISFAADGSVAVKTKTETVSLNAEVKLGSFVVTGPGEYDVADIHCDSRMAGEALASFIRAEDLTVTYLSQLDTEVTKLADASATNILVADIRSDDKPDQLKSIVKALEPSYVVITGAGATKDFVAGLGLAPVEGSLKLTRAGLPLEGTSVLAPA